MSVLKTLTINGTTYKVSSVVPTSSVTLLADRWVMDEKGYSQVVEVANVTPHSKVNFQPTNEQLDEFLYKILAFVAKNDNGTVTVYSVGDKPSGDHTIQITLKEVEGTGPIWGNTVGTPTSSDTMAEMLQIAEMQGQIDAIRKSMGYVPGDVVLEEQTLTGFASATILTPVMVEFDGLVLGNTYIVVWDGKEYNCLCQTGAKGGSMTINSPYLGNPGIFFDMAGISDHPDTGEEFMIICGNDGTAVMSSEEADSHTIAIYLGEAGKKELPPVTTDDNGKFLRVVDGAWAAVAVDKAEEASF